MTTSLADVILAHIDIQLESVFTTIPATVTSINKLKENKISVQPTINRVGTDSVSVEHPILPDLPIQWPSGGGGILTFPLKVGDDVLVVFSMRSIAELQLSSSGTVDPSDSRLHSLSDGYVIPSIHRQPNVLEVDTDNVTLNFNDASISITPESDIVLENSKVSISADPDGNVNIENEVGSFLMDGATGDVDINGAVIDAATGNLTTKLGTNLDAFKAVYDAHIIVYDAHIVTYLAHTHTGSPTAPLGAVSPTGTPI